jgi:hypothetical protein
MDNPLTGNRCGVRFLEQTLLQASREPHHRCESCPAYMTQQFVMLMYGLPIGVRCIVGSRCQAKALTEVGVPQLQHHPAI